MPGWAWVLIAIAVVVVVGMIVWRALATRRTHSLQERFGPEYDRTAERAGGRREAESELAARRDRREQLDIRPLPAEARERYGRQWETVQTQFVDSPPAAIEAADSLVTRVMADRGYPTDEFDQRAADVSVDHPVVVENYRKAHDISLRSDRGEATTEELRQAMQHYRSLFDELLGGPDGDTAADQPLRRDRADEPVRGSRATTERTVR
jgi:hypothetical protein